MTDNTPFRVWSTHKNEDYLYLDQLSSEMFTYSGAPIYVHKYLGPIPQGQVSSEAFLSNITGTTDATQNTTTTPNETVIQDLLYLEIRDRKYQKNIIELAGYYTPGDPEFDLTQFFMMPTDTIFIELHLNNSIKQLGRKIMPGDVIELPNERDDALLDPKHPAINKWFVVQEVGRASHGYSLTWRPHILRCKCELLKDTPEFDSLLSQQAVDINGDPIANTSIKDLISTFGKSIEISDAILEQAGNNVDKRNYENLHLFVKAGPGPIPDDLIPFIQNGDTKPPNGAPLSGSGVSFPSNPLEGDYFLRTDYNPNRLFQRKGTIWIAVEDDYRGKWSAANRILQSFINNENITNLGNEVAPILIPEKQNLSQVIKPKADN